MWNSATPGRSTRWKCTSSVKPISKRVGVAFGETGSVKPDKVGGYRPRAAEATSALRHAAGLSRA